MIKEEKRSSFWEMLVEGGQQEAQKVSYIVENDIFYDLSAVCLGSMLDRL